MCSFQTLTMKNICVCLLHHFIYHDKITSAYVYGLLVLSLVVVSHCDLRGLESHVSEVGREEVVVSQDLPTWYSRHARHILR